MFFTRNCSPVPQVALKTRLSQQAGFTLLEILVVMSIVLLMTSVIVLGFTGADRNTRIKTEAQRVALLIELARSQATQSNREWGLYIEAQEYSFVALNPITGIWEPLEQREFRKRKLPDEINFRLLSFTKPDSPAIVYPSNTDSAPDSEAETPDVVIFSDGELTPFKLDVRVDQEHAVWLVQTDGLSRVSAERVAREN